MAKALGRLNTVVMIERVVAEFTKRDNAARLVKRANHEIWRNGCSGRRQAQRRKPLHFARIHRPSGKRARVPN